MKRLALGLVFHVAMASSSLAQARLPIIDMHVHAHAADHQGPPPRAICAPFTQFPSWDPARPWAEALGTIQKDPPCERPLWSPRTDEALRDATLEVLKRRNIIGVLSGPPGRVQQWKTLAPDRLIPGLELFGRDANLPADALRELHRVGRLAVLAEVSNQICGYRAQ